MIITTIRLTIFSFLLVYSLQVSAQKAKDQNIVSQELAQKINTSSFAKVPVRLAIVRFVPVQGSVVTSNAYGEYLTESIIGKLAEHSDKIKLFERKRLDAILKENELMLSGMMKPSEALKIGELLPIDALFSGTYTKLKSYIDVSGRLIDVVSGEIIMSYSGRIKLSKNLKTLFPEAAVAEKESTSGQTIIEKKVTPAKEEIIDVGTKCKNKTDQFAAKLHDLSTEAKVDVLVQEAMRTPFENVCGNLHYHFISALSRYSLKPELYKKFLLSTLDTIAFPSGDERAYAILSYLTKDHDVDKDEWRVGFNTVRKVGDYRLSTYLGFLFNRVSQPDFIELQNRSDIYFQSLNQNQIGLPRPIDYNKGFFEMMEGLSDNQPLRLFVYEKYGGKLVTESDKVVSSHFIYLKKMYEGEQSPEIKTKVMGWIANYFNKHVYGKSSEQLYDLAYQFKTDPNPEKNQYKIAENKKKEIQYPAKDLTLLIEQCRDKFSSYAKDTPYPSQKDDRILFCVKHGIAVPGEIPTLAEAEGILKENDLDEQTRIMKLLLHMDQKTQPLENTLISMLKRKSLEDKETLQDIQSMAVEILGTIRTKNSSAIQHMINELKNFDYKSSDRAKEALVKIGSPAVNALVSHLNATTNQDGGLQYQIVLILGRIGKDAKVAEPSLRQLLSKTTNKDVRYVIEATLQSILGN